MKRLIAILFLSLLASCTHPVDVLREYTQTLQGRHISHLYGLWGRPDAEGSVGGETFYIWETNYRSSTVLPLTTTKTTTTNHYGNVYGSGGWGTYSGTSYSSTPTTTWIPIDTSGNCRIRVFVSDTNIILGTEVSGNWYGCERYPLPDDYADGGW